MNIFNINFNFNINEEIFESIEECNFSNFTKPGELSILHINIRSKSCNIKLLEAFVFRLKNKPDAIICSEAWLPVCHGFVNIQGYD